MQSNTDRWALSKGQEFSETSIVFRPYQSYLTVAAGLALFRELVNLCRAYLNSPIPNQKEIGLSSPRLALCPALEPPGAAALYPRSQRLRGRKYLVVVLYNSGCAPPSLKSSTPTTTAFNGPSRLADLLFPRGN